jgi:hypothetical protein
MSEDELVTVVGDFGRTVQVFQPTDLPWRSDTFDNYFGRLSALVNADRERRNQVNIARPARQERTPSAFKKVPRSAGSAGLPIDLYAPEAFNSWTVADQGKVNYNLLAFAHHDNFDIFDKATCRNFRSTSDKSWMSMLPSDYITNLGYDLEDLLDETWPKSQRAKRGPQLCTDLEALEASESCDSDGSEDGRDGRATGDEDGSFQPDEDEPMPPADYESQLEASQFMVAEEAEPSLFDE